jgi:hypothetical protein
VATPSSKPTARIHVTASLIARMAKDLRLKKEFAFLADPPTTTRPCKCPKKKLRAPVKVVDEMAIRRSLAQLPPDRVAVLKEILRVGTLVLVYKDGPNAKPVIKTL